MIRRLTRREKRIFIVCVLFILIFFGYTGVFKPMQQQIEFLNNKYTGEQINLDKDVRLVRKAQALSEQYNVHFEKFKQRGTDEQVMSSIFSEIEGVAGDLDLRISDLKPKKVKSLEYINRFSVSLTIDSSFVDIMHFLHNLQSEPHLFDVDELRFDKGSRRMSTAIKTRLVLSKVLIP